MCPIIGLTIDVNGQKHEVVLATPDYGFNRLSAISQCRSNGLEPATIEFARALLQQHENVLRGLVMRENEECSESWWGKDILILGSLIDCDLGELRCDCLHLSGIANDFMPRFGTKSVQCPDEWSVNLETKWDSACGGDIILAIRP